MGQHGLQAKPEPISVNLLQQTPLDTSLGDVLLAKARVVRLIEFKREANKDRKERARVPAPRESVECPRNGLSTRHLTQGALVRSD